MSFDNSMKQRESWGNLSDNDYKTGGWGADIPEKPDEEILNIKEAVNIFNGIYPLKNVQQVSNMAETILDITKPAALLKIAQRADVRMRRYMLIALPENSEDCGILLASLNEFISEMLNEAKTESEAAIKIFYLLYTLMMFYVNTRLGDKQLLLRLQVRINMLFDELML